MESAARAAGIADYPDAPQDLESAPEHTTELDTTTQARNRSNTAHTHPDRVSIPLSQRRSFSTGRHTPTASVRSRANSAFTARTLDLEDAPTVPPTPGLPPFNAPVLAPTQTLQPSEVGQAITTAPEEDADDGPPWDPLHPCWPHLNPHVPLSSPLYKSTRIIRLQRDYRVAGDLYPQYITSFPEILEPYLSQTDFNAYIKTLNTRLAAVFDPLHRKRHWVDSILGVATGWLWDDAGFSGVKSGFRDVERWMEEWNMGSGAERGVVVIGLRRTAFLTLDLQVPDPSGLIVAEGATDAVQRNTNGAGTNAAVNGAVNGNSAYGHMDGYRPGGYSTAVPTKDGGTSVVGANTDGAAATTDGADTDGRSFTTDAATEEAGGTSGYYSGGSTSLRTSGSFSRRRDQQVPRPEVPPIPREYLGFEER